MTYEADTTYRKVDTIRGVKVGTKPTNPKDLVGTNKVPMSCVSGPVMAELALAMFEGSLKYGRHNYRAVGVRTSVYYDAIMRHMMQFWEGEDIDPDSGVSHVTKAIASLVVLRDCMLRGNWVDDRPPESRQGWAAEMNAKAKVLVEKYPDPKPPHTEAGLSFTPQPADPDPLPPINRDPLPYWNPSNSNYYQYGNVDIAAMENKWWRR
jgi:hypothetical protein